MPDLSKVVAGQPVHTALKKETWNALLDAAGVNESSRHQMTRKLRELGRSPGIVRVLNQDTVNWGQFVPVGLIEPFIFPDDNLSAFGETPGFKGDQITTDTKRKYAITLEPIPVGKIGLAVASGVVPVRLDSDASHDDAPTASANLSELTPFSLIPDSNGTAQILWRESGSGSGSSAPWALVRIPRENEGPLARSFFYAAPVLNLTAINTYYPVPFTDDELPDVTGGDVTYDSATYEFTVHGTKKWFHHLHAQAALQYALSPGRTLNVKVWTQWNTSIPSSPFSWTVTSYPAQWAFNQYWPPIGVTDSRSHHQISTDAQADGRKFRVVAYVTSNFGGAIDVDLSCLLNWIEVENQ